MSKDFQQRGKRRGIFHMRPAFTLQEHRGCVDICGFSIQRWNNSLRFTEHLSKLYGDNYLPYAYVSVSFSVLLSTGWMR